MACTFFPEGDWSHCCRDHDKAYTEGSGISKEKADLDLYNCMRAGGRPFLAEIAYMGVNLFGWLRYKGDK